MSTNNSLLQGLISILTLEYKIQDVKSPVISLPMYNNLTSFIINSRNNNFTTKITTFFDIMLDDTILSQHDGMQKSSITINGFKHTLFVLLYNNIYNFQLSCHINSTLWNEMCQYFPNLLTRI